MRPLLKIWLVAFLLCNLLQNQAAALDSKSPTLPSKAYDYSMDLPDHAANLQQFDTTPKDNPTTDHGVTLGRVLFYDHNLSQNQLVRCASCHSQSLGFDDPSRFSIGHKGKITRRHAMGLTNARFNSEGRYFWDERAGSLELQVLQPIFDPVEMGLLPGELVTRIRVLPYYEVLFQNAFGDDEITERKIAKALAQFVRSMTSFQSRYDRQRGNAGNRLEAFAGFSAQENRGKFLFLMPPDMGGAGCVACHRGEAFIMHEPANNGIDDGDAKDRGVGEVTGLQGDDGKFRAASLKNIAMRSPYMHDGRFDTLEEVIAHYSTGVKPHKNLDTRLKERDGTARRLNLVQGDIEALIAFLKTLTETEFLTDQRFSDPFAN